MFTQPYSGTAAGSFLLGTICVPANLLLDKSRTRFGRKHAFTWSIKQYGNWLDTLFNSSLEEEKQVQVTLCNGKVYVGFISNHPKDLVSQNSYFGILPTWSGYRDPTTKEVVLPTGYIDIYSTIWSKNIGSEQQKPNFPDEPNETIPSRKNPDKVSVNSSEAEPFERLVIEDFEKYIRATDVEMASIYDPDVDLIFNE